MTADKSTYTRVKSASSFGTGRRHQNFKRKFSSTRPSTSSTWYTLRRFQLTERGPLCLAPEDWTDTQAVEHLLAK